MAQPEKIGYSDFSEQDVKELNYATLRVRARNVWIENVHLEHFDDGKITAGFATGGYTVNEHAAKLIGMQICKMHPEIDEVWNNGSIVYKPQKKG